LKQFKGEWIFNHGPRTPRSAATCGRSDNRAEFGQHVDRVDGRDSGAVAAPHQTVDPPADLRNLSTLVTAEL